MYIYVYVCILNSSFLCFDCLLYWRAFSPFPLCLLPLILLFLLYGCGTLYFKSTFSLTKMCRVGGQYLASVLLADNFELN